MNKNNLSPRRVSQEFDEYAKEIIRRRLIVKKDKRPKSFRRITAAFARHPLKDDIARDIINADLSEE